MPTYVYRAKDGSEVEEVHPMSDFPREVKRGRKRFELVNVPGNRQTIVHEYQHVAHNFHKKADCIRLGLPLADHYNERGFACFQGLRDIEKHETRMARAGFPKWKYEREKLKAK